VGFQDAKNVAQGWRVDNAPSIVSLNTNKLLLLLLLLQLLRD
jgi:hypothetical protein